MIAAVDVGTSLIKGGIFDREGRLLCQAQSPVTLAETSEPYFYETDPVDWIEALKEVFGAFMCSKEGIEALVVSGNGPTLIAVDQRGNVLYPAIMWMDQRGIEEAGAIIEKAEVSVDSSLFLSKAHWIFTHRPELYERTRFFLSCPEYIDFYLCGRSYTILPSPRFEQYVWNADAIDALGMDRSRFPPFIQPGEIMGSLREKPAEQLGLQPGIQVVAGGPDYIMSLLGTGTTEPGMSCDRAGTSEGINYCSRVPVDDRRLICLPHILEDLYNISGVVSTSGKAIEWFREFSGYPKDFEVLMRDISRARPGSKGLIFLPYLTGERSPIWDPHARGTLVGLTLEHGRGEIARAVAESIGFAIRDVLEVMAEHGFSTDEIRVAGSQSQVGILNQIKADITGKRILVPTVADSELVGDACIGLTSIGQFDTFADASRGSVRIKSELEPKRENLALYTEMFYLYREIYSGLKDAFRRLNNS
jgi:xylulokinase